MQPIGPLTYAVFNRTKGTRYTVRFVAIHGRPFEQCWCEAGTPARADQIPLTFIGISLLLGGWLCWLVILPARRATKVYFDGGVAVRVSEPVSTTIRT